MKSASIAAIVEAVAVQGAVSVADLRSPDRHRHIVRIRQRAYWVCRAIRPDISLPWLGRYFCRHHTTVLYGIRKHGERREADPLERRLDDAIVVQFHVQITRARRRERFRVLGRAFGLLLAAAREVLRGRP